jgi:hypothetical protein
VVDELHYTENYYILQHVFFNSVVGFIFIEMTKIVGSPSLTQPLLLYPGLGRTMLDNIGGVKSEKKICCRLQIIFSHMCRLTFLLQQFW